MADKTSFQNIVQKSSIPGFTFENFIAIVDNHYLDQFFVDAGIRGQEKYDLIAIRDRARAAIAAPPQVDASFINNFIETIKHCELDKIGTDNANHDDDSTSNGAALTSDTVTKPYLLTSTATDISWLDNLVESKSLFIRNCYQDFSNLIKSRHIRKFLISGTPGIGKSTFLSFFVFELVQLQKSDLLKDGVNVGDKSFSIIVDFDEIFALITTEKTDQGTEIMIKVDQRTGHAFGGANGALYNTSNYYIFDARKEATPLLVKAKSVVASSPNRNNYKEFEKQNPVKYYMPTWTYDELSLLREHCFITWPIEEMDERYEYYGGVPRICLVGEFDKANWKSIINDCNVENAMNMIGRGTIADSETNVINHRLIHIVPNDNYTSATLEFGSQKICDAFLLQYYDRVEAKFVEFINTKTDTIYAGLRGQLFEAYAHRVIAAGGNFEIRNLTDGKTSEVELSTANIEYFSENLPSDLSSSSASSSSSSSSSVSGSNHGTKPKYFIPQSKIFAVVDSFSDDRFFQMTVSEKHPMIKHLLQKLLNHLKYKVKGKPCLYFVVPEDKFKNFKLQNYNGNDGKKLKDQSPIVEQFALCISMSQTSDFHKKQKLGK